MFADVEDVARQLDLAPGSLLAEAHAVFADLANVKSRYWHTHLSDELYTQIVDLELRYLHLLDRMER